MSLWDRFREALDRPAPERIRGQLSIDEASVLPERELSRDEVVRRVVAEKISQKGKENP